MRERNTMIERQCKSKIYVRGTHVHKGMSFETFIESRANILAFFLSVLWLFLLTWFVEFIFLGEYGIEFLIFSLELWFLSSCATIIWIAFSILQGRNPHFLRQEFLYRCNPATRTHKVSALRIAQWVGLVGSKWLARVSTHRDKSW